MDYFKFVFSVLLCWVAGLKAQHYPAYTLYSFNKTAFNPAAAGLSGSFCINSNHHRQYLGLNEPPPDLETQMGEELTNGLKNIAPVTSVLGLQAPVIIGEKQLGGASFTFIDDEVGYEKNVYYKLGLSGIVKINYDWQISAGIEYTNQSKSLKNVFKPHQWPDPRIPIGVNPEKRGNLGAGIMITSPAFNNFYAGISAMQLLNREFVYGNMSIQTALHGFITSGMQIENFTGNKNWRMDPSLLLILAKDIKGIVRPTINLQSLAVYQNRYSIGLGFRSTLKAQFDAASLMLGFYPLLNSDLPWQRTLRIGYAYDIPMQSIASNGTHEIQINLCIPIIEAFAPGHPRDMDRKHIPD